MQQPWVVLGGSGFVGTAVRRELHRRGAEVTVVDTVEPVRLPGERWLHLDLRTDELDLPPGRLVLSYGQSMPRPVRPWTLVLDNALVSARLAPHLLGREVTLLSTVEVYGAAPGPLREDSAAVLPATGADFERWVAAALAEPGAPATPAEAVGRCRELADLDPSGRWVYALSKAAQELIVRSAGPDRLCVLRLANVVGPGQYRLLGRLVEAMMEERGPVVTDTVRSFVGLADVARIVAESPTLEGTFNVSAGRRRLVDVAGIVAAALNRRPLLTLTAPPPGDSSGDVDGTALAALVGPYADLDAEIGCAAVEFAESAAPMFRPPIDVVIPPRPHRPDAVARQTMASLWTGRLRGGSYGRELADRLAAHLGLSEGRRLVLTNSGTNAIRLAVTAAAGQPPPGGVALCPAYTFHASAEVLRQLGWRVRLIDVDPWTWTLDPALVREALAEDPRVGLVLAVDALGNPADYRALAEVCGQVGIPLVADSAPALGARHDGDPVANQAAAHGYSMSFAKTLSGGGSGGAAVLPEDAAPDVHNWARSSPMPEPVAIAALDQLLVLDELLARRRRVAQIYEAALSIRPGFVPQRVRPGDTHAWVHWVVRVPPAIGRDRLARGLAAQGVITKPYYEPLADPADRPTPVTDLLHQQCLALPMSSEMSVDDAERVVAATQRAVRRLSAAPPAASASAAGTA